jgi:RNase P subunit RPR2
MTMPAVYQVRPERHNQRSSKCCRCGKPLSVGEGQRIRVRKIATHNVGFACAECAGIILHIQATPHQGGA